MGRKLFCEICPAAYKISLLKEYLLKDIEDLLSGEKFSKNKSSDILPVIIKGHRSLILRELVGVDMQLQRNKAVNLKIAGDMVNGILISPGETFSFWKIIGCPTSKKGYLKGLTIFNQKLCENIGGGLCQLANLIHWLVLNSPLTVTQISHHTDALFPDSNRRVPFGSGTGVFYKHIDYRFKNTTNQTIQLLIWQSEGDICGELRSTEKFPDTYHIIEENAGYIKERDDFYRVSQIYRLVFNQNKEIVKKELLLNNHSKVMYDYSLIPEDEIIKAQIACVED